MNYRNFDKRPVDKRQFLYTHRECAAFAGVTPRSWELWRKRWPGQPKPPTSKPAVTAYLDRYGLPLPTNKPTTELKVVAMKLRNPELTHQQIADAVHIARQNVGRCLKQYQQRKDKQRAQK